MWKALSVTSLGTFCILGHKIYATGPCFVSFSLVFVHVFVFQSSYVKKRFAESRSWFLIEWGLF